MTVTAHVYTKFISGAIEKGLNLSSDSLKCMLLSAYTVGSTQDTAEYVTDVLAAASECTGSGYTAGGQLLTGITITETDASHLVTVTCADPEWGSVTISPAYALFYDSEPGSNAANPVICYWNFGGAITVADGTFQVQISESGLLTLTGS